ncbi:MAG: sigma-70 family RNA polymerase sigma factor [Bacteroidetes bacterium]|nr:sigma-70 family RNA polymerase sigma factor [Bacteroidota bacterium]
MPDEARLVKQCLKKDERALNELYKRFASRMFGVCLRYSKDRMEAEDMLHDGFIKVLGNLENFRHEGSFEGWMRRLMVNTAINQYRKRISMGETDFEAANISETEMADDDAIVGLSVQELLELVRNLPDGYRIIFNLHVIEGYKHNEIAEILNISENTSKSQLAKARKYLQMTLKKLQYETVG